MRTAGAGDFELGQGRLQAATLFLGVLANVDGDFQSDFAVPP